MGQGRLNVTSLQADQVSESLSMARKAEEEAINLPKMTP